VRDRLQKQVALEREQLRRLFETHRPLLEKCQSVPPDAIELSALAAFLHSFYNGSRTLWGQSNYERIVRGKRVTLFCSE
jgi:hypothetical protein